MEEGAVVLLRRRWDQQTWGPVLREERVLGRKEFEYMTKLEWKGKFH